jgi:hypothetical protein
VVIPDNNEDARLRLGFAKTKLLADPSRLFSLQVGFALSVASTIECTR